MSCMDTAIDLVALAREAGVPPDDPGVARLVRLVAGACASMCDGAQPIAHADHVSEAHARAVGRELGLQIRAAFEVY
jgi:hypothetical protein